jgi:D-sedoheptulose 7-phosphate isomerase
MINLENLIIDSIDLTINNYSILKQKKFLTSIIKASKILHNCIKKKKKIIFCGNGGSAADAQHLTAELIGEFLKKKRQSIPAISLTTNTSVITSIANDKNYDEIFSRQIQGLSNKNDVLYAISTSGKSKNVIKAIKVAKKKGCKIVLITGSKKISDKSIDVVINVPAKRVDRIQEMHIFIGHILCEFLEKQFS